MGLSRKQFDVLVAIVDWPKAAQRKLQEVTGYSLGTVSKIVKELVELGMVEPTRVMKRSSHIRLKEQYLLQQDLVRDLFQLH